MGLREYLHKRVFGKTPEPKGRVHHEGHKLRFVVQRHNASHLHFDFRLELDGVLKSWAIPKGISLDPHEHHLAIQTEDHPIEYLNFKGRIPKGNYGAGTVSIYDHGYYEPREQTLDQTRSIRSGLRQGHLTFVLHGQHLKGEFALIKNEHFEKNAWLLIKKGDEYAKPTPSVPKTITRKRAHKAMPQHVRPMLATLVDEPFDGAEWSFEIKWDGYRGLGSWDGEHAKLYSRNGSDFANKFADIYVSLSQLGKPCLVDGEIVAVDKHGQPHFEWLQNWASQPQGELVYYVFDLLWLDGQDMRDLPLNERQAQLKKLIPKSSPIRYSEPVTVNGKAFFDQAAKNNLEGIMAKKISSSYQSGKRTRDWLKIKTHQRQEVVIGGYTEPRGSREDLGSLMVGVYDKNKLIFAGHVGTGMDPSVLKQLHDKLSKLEVKESPFTEVPKANDVVHWVRPKLVCEVKFAEWTSEGSLRQPVFVGLRDDKPASQVVREQQQGSGKIGNIPKTADSDLVMTHLDKVFWPESKLTKGDLLKYYESVADTILPYLKDRPQSLLRQPDGYKGQAFFQKDIASFAPSWAKTTSIHSESAHKEVEYLICNDIKTLRYMVQLGCIEINPWNSRLKSLTKPDWVVVDLDPEGVSFEKVVEVAKVVHQVCEELKIPSYPKTSGKTGIHVFIPMGAKYSYDQARQFAQLLVTLVHERTLTLTSLERNPQKRQHRIYLDYLQNSEGQTLACAYCVRPTKSASVSTPLHWDEIKKGLDPTKFTIANTSSRIRRVGDLFQPVLGKGINLRQVLNKLPTDSD